MPQIPGAEVLGDGALKGGKFGEKKILNSPVQPPVSARVSGVRQGAAGLFIRYTVSSPAAGVKGGGKLGLKNWLRRRATTRIICQKKG